MSQIENVRRRIRWVVGGSLAIVVLAVGPGAVAAQSGMGAPWEATPGHVARSVAHLIGIGGGLVIVYNADAIRRRTGGSTLGTSMQFVEAGTVVFVLVFLGMEAEHLLGIHLWYFADTMAITQLWYMIALAAVMLLYTLAYRNLVVEMGG